jgi:hypothetical protein
LLRGGKSSKGTAIVPAPATHPARYDVYLVNGAGHIIGVESIMSSSKHAALNNAHQRLQAHAKCLCIELWDEQHCIAVVERG